MSLSSASATVSLLLNKLCSKPPDSPEDMHMLNKFRKNSIRREEKRLLHPGAAITCAKSLPCGREPPTRRAQGRYFSRSRRALSSSTDVSSLVIEKHQRSIARWQVRTSALRSCRMSLRKVDVGRCQSTRQWNYAVNRSDWRCREFCI